MNLTASIFPDPAVRVRFARALGDGIARYLWMEDLAIHVEHMPDPGQWLRDLAAVCLDAADRIEQERAS
jgi:hypothetical protein